MGKRLLAVRKFSLKSQLSRKENCRNECQHSRAFPLEKKGQVEAIAGMIGVVLVGMICAFGALSRDAI
jgi:hypothetical protein